MTTRTNLCSNPSFEVSLAGWSATSSAATISQVTGAGVVVGTKAMQVTIPAPSRTVTAGQPIRYSQNGVSFIFTGLTGGLAYTVSASVTVLSGTQVVGFDASGTTQSNLVTKRVSYTFTAGSASFTARLTNQGNGTASTFAVDAVLFEQAGAMGPYFDGDTTGCSWTGTAGLSTSTQPVPPPTITVTNDPTNSPPRNIIFLSGITGTLPQVTRTDTSGQRTAVRGGDPAQTVGGSAVIYDVEVPPNAAATYTVTPTDGSAAVSTLASPLIVTEPWLVDPGVPSQSVQINGLKRGQRAQDSGAAKHVILGSQYSTFITDGSRKGTTYPLSIRTQTDDDNTRLRAILSSSKVLLLKIAYPFTSTTVTQFINVDTVTEDEVTGLFGDPKRLWTLNCEITSRPVGGIAAQRTVADVAGESATIADEAAKFATVQGMLTGVQGT